MSTDREWPPDGMESPAERTDPLLPKIPTLDDEALVTLLAELDGEAQPDDPPDTPELTDSPARLLAHPALPAQPTVQRADRDAASGYVRREYRPPPPPAEALSLTGLTRRCGGRIGSVVFTLVFLAIFLLILVQAVVSVLTAGT